VDTKTSVVAKRETFDHKGGARMLVAPGYKDDTIGRRMRMSLSFGTLVLKMREFLNSIRSLLNEKEDGGE
jgi:hypothetical protein